MNEFIKNIEAAQLKENVPSFNVGDTVKVKVIQKKEGKLSLSMKALLTDDAAEPRYERESAHFKSEGDAATNLGALLAGIKLD